MPKPPPTPKPADDDRDATAEDAGDKAPQRKVPPPYRRAWAELLKATFGVDFLTCPKCAASMRVVASLTHPDSIKAYLTGVRLWEAPYPIAPARSPPQQQLDMNDCVDCSDEDEDDDEDAFADAA